MTATDASRNGNRQSNRKKHCGGNEYHRCRHNAYQHPPITGSPWQTTPDGQSSAISRFSSLQWQAVERHFIRRVFTVAFRGIGNHLDFQTMRLTMPAHRILEFATSQRATPMQRAVGIGRLGSPASLRKGYSRRSTSSSSRYHAPACCASKCSPGSNLTCCNGTHSRTYETIDALLCVVIMRHSREYVIKRVKRLLDAILHKNTSRTRIGICFFRHVIDKHWLEHMHIHARQTTP